MPVATALLVAAAASVANVRVAAASGGGTPLNRAASAKCVALALGATAIGCMTTPAWPRVEAGTVTAMPPMPIASRTFRITKKACGARR